jgi:SAM-dependent methyltransferase
MRAVLQGLGYPDETDFNDVNIDLSRVGLGIGDDWKVARALYQKFMYTNSYLDKFPIVDLLDPPSASIEKFEFITCSDVLEHTPPPRKTPIANIYRMLKPGGFVVISVPIKPDDTYREYYSGLVSWNFSDSALHWSDSDGRNFIDSYPEIHGGEGLTVAFRQWSKKQLEEDLNLLGFSQIHFLPGKTVVGIPTQSPPVIDPFLRAETMEKKRKLETISYQHRARSQNQNLSPTFVPLLEVETGIH